jgi:hypothetical protein
VKITQDVNIESRAVLDDGVAGIVATLCSTHEVLVEANPMRVHGVNLPAAQLDVRA